MSSVAYSAQPAGPGWWRTAWLVFRGWVTAAVALGGLYVAGWYLGAIGSNQSGAGTTGGHAINDWPFPENGTWSLLADISVFVLALCITTVAIAWQLRPDFPMVSEGRLLVVLFFAGGIPYLTWNESAPVFFALAVWAVRAWVGRDELRIPRWPLVAIGVGCVVTIASYGVLHPVWLESASTSTPVGKSPELTLVLSNHGRVAVEVQRLTANGPLTHVRAGWPWEDASRLPVHIRAGHSEIFTLQLPAGGCGGLSGSIRYRVYGLTRSEPLRVTPSEFPAC